MLTKTSILVFFLQISKDESIFRYLNLLTLLVTNVGGLALTFVNAFQCHPVSQTFIYPSPSSVICIDIVTLYLSSVSLVPGLVGSTNQQKGAVRVIGTIVYS